MCLSRLLVVPCCLLASFVATPGAAETPTADNIAKLLRELDDDSYQVRERATAELIKLGRPAVEAVAAAAEGQSLEVSRRCMQALTMWRESDNAELKAAANEALKGLIKSKNEHVASKARELIEPAKQPEAPAANPFNFNIQVRQVQLAGQRGVRIQNNNGLKTIDVNENGKQTHIEENPQGGIKVKVTEKVDGKEKSTTHEVKNAEELKKKLPDVFKLYQKYGQQRAAPRIALQIAAQALPMRRLVPAAKPDGVKKAVQQIEAAQKQLKQSIEAMQKLAHSKAPAEDVKQMTEQIEAAIKQLEEAQRQLK